MARLDPILFSIHFFGFQGILALAVLSVPAVAGLFVPRIDAVAWILFEAVLIGNVVAYAAFVVPLAVLILKSRSQVVRRA